jgi:hypothetical protein
MADGDWANDIRDGYGKMTFARGLTYEVSIRMLSLETRFSRIVGNK